MSKPSAFMRRITAAAAREQYIRRLFTIQQCKDMMLIAANDALGAGPERLKRLSDSFDAAFSLYLKKALEEANGGEGDTDIMATRAAIDGKLAEICGKYFVPWDKRYDGKC